MAGAVVEQHPLVAAERGDGRVHVAVAVDVDARDAVVVPARVARHPHRRLVGEMRRAVVDQELLGVAGPGVVDPEIEIAVAVDVAGDGAVLEPRLRRERRRRVGEDAGAVVDPQQRFVGVQIDEQIEIVIPVGVEEIEIDGLTTRPARELPRRHLGELAGAVVEVEVRRSRRRAHPAVAHEQIEVAVAVDVAEARRARVRVEVRQARRRVVHEGSPVVEEEHVGVAPRARDVEIHVTVAVDIPGRALADVARVPLDDGLRAVAEHARSIVQVDRERLRDPLLEVPISVGKEDVEIAVAVDVRHLHVVGPATDLGPRATLDAERVGDLLEIRCSARGSGGARQREHGESSERAQRKSAGGHETSLSGRRRYRKRA